MSMTENENEKHVASGAAEWDRQAEANRKIRERLSIDILLSSLGLDRDREAKEAAEWREREAEAIREQEE